MANMASVELKQALATSRIHMQITCCAKKRKIDIYGHFPIPLPGKLMCFQGECNCTVLLMTTNPPPYVSMEIFLDML